MWGDMRSALRANTAATMVADIVGAMLVAVASALLAMPSLRDRGFTITWTGAIGLAVLARIGRRRWLVYVTVFGIITAATYMRAGFDWQPSSVRGLADAVIFVASARWLQRSVPRTPATVMEAWAFLRVAGGTGLARAAVALVIWIVWTPPEFTGLLVPVVGVALGTAIGILVFVPVVLLASRRRHWRSGGGRMWRSGSAWVAVTAFVQFAAFVHATGERYLGLSFLVVPLIVMFAAVYPPVLLAIELALVALGATYATALRLGPFIAASGGDLRIAGFSTQAFLISLPVAAWLLAGAVAANRADRASLQQLVDVDAVTGLPSATRMTSELQAALDAHAGMPTAVGVMLVDLSEFHVINRTFGFEAGNAVLRTLGQAIREALPEQFVLGRFEGNGLLVVCPACPSTEGLGFVAAGVLEAVAQETVAFGRRISRSASIGIALAGPDATAVSLLRDADQALLRAKGEGRSRFHILSRAYSEGEAIAPLELEHDLRNALDAGQFVLHYQPQVRLDDGAVCGFEALVRWQHPQRGLLAPAAFIEVMEASGLVIPLGRFVVRAVCHHLVAHAQLEVPVSINVSAVEIAEPQWLQDVLAVLEETGARPDRLVLEITESTALALTPRAVAGLEALRAMGVGLHIDDFGVGYTSIGQLQHLPATAIKLDRTFVVGLEPGNAEAVALVHAIAALASGLGLETIAEGVEFDVQAEVLRATGWHMAQGYLFGHPAPAA